MAMQESGEMYLETILILAGQRPVVRAVHVGDYMGYSKPSVSRAMGLLREKGYIKVDATGAITLTQAGREIAERIYERHTVLTALLVSIGVDAVQDDIRPQVAGQDDDGVFEVDRAPLAIGDTPVVQHLQ